MKARHNGRREPRLVTHARSPGAGHVEPGDWRRARAPRLADIAHGRLARDQEEAQRIVRRLLAKSSVIGAVAKRALVDARGMGGSGACRENPGHTRFVRLVFSIFR